MSLICLISFLALVSLWFFAKEYPAVTDVYMHASALKRVYSKVLLALALVSCVMLSGRAGVGESLMECWRFGAGDGQYLILCILSSLLILVILKMFSVSGSVAYAFIGAMAAYGYCTTGDLNAGMMFSFLAAPLMAFLLSASFRYIFKKTLHRSHIHLVTLSYYMRLAVIAGMVLTGCAIGLNCGGFLLAGTSVIFGNDLAIVVAVLILVAVMTVLSSLLRSESDRNADLYEDFSIYTILSVGFAVAGTLFFFSFERPTSMLGLHPAPISVSSLVFAAIAGAGFVKRTRLVETEEYVREAFALISAPTGSFLLSFILIHISIRNEEHIVDFTVLASTLILVIALVFAGYMHRSRRQREAMAGLVYLQQQQIYENSRALNDMELKVVLSENQALHNSIEMKKQEVMNVALSIVEQKEFLESLNEIVRKLSKSADESERNELIARLSASLKQRLSYDRDVDSQYFYAQAEYLHEDFNAKLTGRFPDLTQQEIRLATMLRLGFSSKYIATLMNITPKSVEISRYRLRQKLGLSKGDNLVNFIKSI
ncbi:MAG: response regulator transcription factor [Bacteroidales bacterium]|nr:response regulator transcription factor [Bacteroidales bacterium]